PCPSPINGRGDALFDGMRMTGGVARVKPGKMRLRHLRTSEGDRLVGSVVKCVCRVRAALTLSLSHKWERGRFVRWLANDRRRSPGATRGDAPAASAHDAWVTGLLFPNSFGAGETQLRAERLDIGFEQRPLHVAAAAVDRYGRTGDERGAVAGEEGDQLGDLLGAAKIG